MKTRFVPRRKFLQICGVGSGLFLSASRLSPLWAKDPAAAGSLIVREANPFNAEPPLRSLVSSWITPVDKFFVRNHGNIPQIERGSFQLQIEGMIETPMSISLDELTDKFAASSTTATITCAGNRRIEFADKRIKGVGWHSGAIGNAEWSGVKLADVLKAAGLKPEVRHIWFEGGDEVKHKDETIAFGASVPIERVMQVSGGNVGVLLATMMNGQALTAEHGAPLRAVTPGYIGARSVKWLRRIVASDKPSPNHFVAHAYKVVEEDTIPAHEATDPIYEYVLNSAIANVDRNGTYRVSGYALPSGKPHTRIKQVELSADEGKTWHLAQLDKQAADYCWQLWNADISALKDTKRLLVRATDTRGITQPQQMPFNAKGYQFNGWHATEL